MKLNTSLKPHCKTVRTVSLQVSVLLLVFLLYSNGITAQNANTTLPSLGTDGELMYPEEAPTALFEYDIEDRSVEFFLLGTWEAKLGFAAGMGWIPDGTGGYTTQSILPRALVSTPLTNTVDLVLSLWIEQRFFFESSFRSGFRDNSILAGYYGEGILRELKLGNTDIGIGDYPMLPLGDGPAGSPGVSVVLADVLGSRSRRIEGSLHELMLRYETSTLVERHFQGNREFIQEDYGIHEALSSSLFLLPHSTVENLSVLIQSEAGQSGQYIDSRSGEAYRRLEAGREYGLRDDIPLLSFSPSLLDEEEPDGSGRMPKILVRYRGNGSYPEEDFFSGDIHVSRLYGADPGISREEVTFSLQPGADFHEYVVKPLDALSGGSSESNIDLEDFTVTLNGDTYLVLHDPLIFSPFSVRSRYASFASPSSVQLIGPDSRSNAVPFQTIQADSSADVEILPAESPDLSDEPSPDLPDEPWRIRYPLLTLSDDPAFLETVGNAYGPLSPEAAELPDTQARGIRGYRLRFLSEQGEGLRIDQEIVPGTLQVYRNGVLEESAYLEEGVVILPDEIASNDAIQLRYRIPDPSGVSGSLSFAAGQKVFLPGDQLWTVSAGGSVVLPSRTDPDSGSEDALEGSQDSPAQDAPDSGDSDSDGDGDGNGEARLADVHPEFYSNLPGTPGYIQLGSSYSYQNDLIEISVQGALGIYSGGSGDPLFSPGDTNGRLDVQLSPLTLVPSAPPDMPASSETPPYNNQLQNLDVPQLPGLSGLEFTHETRGRLFFRNYRSSLRGILLTKAQAESGGMPGRVDGVSGPYPVLASEADSDAAAVEGVVSILEFDLDAGSWVGYQARGSSSGTMQIPEGFAVEVLPDSLEPQSGELHVFLQLGAISEDSDADRTLDIQPDPNATGYEFNGWDGDLTAGYPGEAYNSGYTGTGEDLNSNGRLDARVSPAMTSLYLGSITGSDQGSWKTLEGDFTEQQRNVLLNHPDVRENLRVVVYSSQDAQGVLQFGGHRYTHIPVLLQGSITHAGGDVDNPGGTAPQSSLQIQRYRYSSSDNGTIRFPLGGIPQGLYSRILLPVFVQSSSALPEFQIRVNSFSAGFLTIPTGETWYQIAIDWKRSSLLLIDSEGGILSESPLPPALEESGPLNSLSLSFTPAGPGELYIQKPYFTGLDIQPGAGLQTSVNLSPGLRTHSSPWLSFALERVEFRGNAYSRNYRNGNGSYGGITLRGRVPMFAAEISGELSTPDYERKSIDLEFGHALEFDPIQGLLISNSFSRNFTPGVIIPDESSRRISQDLSLSAEPADLLSTSLGYSFALDSLSLDRSWDFSGELTPGELTRMSMGLGLAVSEDNSRRAALFYEDSPQGYANQYVRSLGQIDWTETPQDFYRRKLNMETSGGISGENLNLELDGLYRSEMTIAGDTRFSTGIEQRQSLSFTVLEGIQISLSQRSRASVVSSREAGSLGEQLDASYAQLADAPLMWLPLGIAGIFDPALGEKFSTQFLEVSVFQPLRSSELDYLFETGFSRVPDSGISGLLLPVGADISLSRKIAWQDALVRDLRFVSGGIDWQALNVFGKQGRTPVFSFYDSDDYFYTIEMGMNMNRREIWRGAFTSQSILYFPGTLDALELNGDAEYWNRGPVASHFSLEAGLSWVSELNPGGSLNSFLQRHGSEEQPGNLSIRHREGIEISFSSAPETRTVLSDDWEIPPDWLQPATGATEVLVSHSSSLRFSSIGSLTLAVKGAYENELLEEINYQKSHKIGIQIDAILELSY